MLDRTVFVIAIGLSLLACKGASALHQTGISENAQGVSQMPVIRFSQTDRDVIEVTGLDPMGLAKLHQASLQNEQWTALFKVCPGPAEASDIPAMLGSYDVQGANIRFTPRFPLVAGLTYKARFNLSSFHQQFGMTGSASTQSIIEVDLALPKETGGSKTIVSEIYPSAAELPANQLKFYLYFSAPMSIGEAYRRVHLFDEKGREAPRAFLRVDQELWDPQRQRFTLLFDPGRVKRGLRSNVEDGAPLKEGKRYRLVIDREWHDGDGNALGEAREKWFTVIAADRTAPDSTAWKIRVPAAETREPVKLTFDEALDGALLEEMVTVIDANDNRIEGRIDIAKGETEWLLTPNTPWRAGSYRLLVDENLEDRAGNNLRRLFDADLNTQSPARIEPNRICLPFSITPANVQTRVSNEKSITGKND